MNTNPSVTLLNKTGNCISRLSIMKPEELAPLAIDGLLKGKPVIVPGRMNKVFLLLDKMLPEKIKDLLTGSTMKKINPDHSLVRYLSVVAEPGTGEQAIA
jgi:hypothetical protein